MRFYTRAHKHYRGIDLHARSMYICVLNQEGVVVLHRNLPCDPGRLLSAIHPYREELVVGVECIFTVSFRQGCMKAEPPRGTVMSTEDGSWRGRDGVRRHRV